MRKYLLASVAALGLVAGASSSAFAQLAKPPAPGTIQVYIHGLINDQVNMIGGSGYADTNGVKLNPVGMSGFIRIYPGFDGTTESGIQYGVHAELRTSSSSAGKGVNGGGDGTMPYWRRAYMYAGTSEAGFVRLGQTDGIWWLLATGEYYDFGDGNLWNSDGGVGAAVPGNIGVGGLFTSTGALYTTNKIVYISPDIAGFKVGFDYEPSSNGFKEGIGCDVGSASCGLASSVPGGVVGRRKNTVTGGIEYSGEFSGVGVKAAVDYMYGAPLGDSTGTAALPSKNIEVGEISAEIKYAGLTVGANAKDGQVAHGYGALVEGQRKDLFLEVNAIYDFGPYTVGGYYFNDQSAGAHTAATPQYGDTQTNWGIALGANYALSKNFGVYATYLYGQKHQAGYDFIAGAPGVQSDVHSQAFSLGAAMKW